MRLFLFLLTAILAIRPPEQTKAQKDLLAKWHSKAAQLSKDATKTLLNLIEAPSVQQEIKDCPDLKGKNASYLLNWFVGSIRRMDVIMSFPLAVAWGNMSSSGHVWNKWQLQHFYHLYDGPSKGKLELAEWVETRMADFPPIKDLLHPLEDDANTRPIYFSVNIWKRRNGNPMYGDTTLVLHPSMKKNLLMLPSDSGWFYKDCVEKRPTPGDPPTNCTGYPLGSAIGTFEHFHHVLVAHVHFYRYSIGKLFRRACNDSLETANPFVNWYLEGQLAAACYIPEHIWFAIANFSIFGTSTAKPLQAFSTKNSKVMLWTGNTDHAFVDPVVGNLGGYTITQSDKDMFNQKWKSNKGWFDTYLAIGPSLHLYPLREEDCSSSGYCGPHCDYLGTNSKGNCLWSGHKGTSDEGVE